MNNLFHPTIYNGINYLSMLGFKFNHISKILTYIKQYIQNILEALITDPYYNFKDGCANCR